MTDPLKCKACERRFLSDVLLQEQMRFLVATEGEAAARFDLRDFLREDHALHAAYEEGEP